MPMLNRAECAALRGLAIIGIFLHNYCHWLPGIVRENEYQFFQKNVDGLGRAISNPDWLLPMHIVSFFGHYGVPVFLFLSAYGLEMKYGNSDRTDGIWSFLRKHFVKLFMMMIVGFALFTAVDAITPGAHHYKLLDVVSQLLMFNNVLPHPNRIIWPGPYWFFGLMMQLYIVYRLLLYRRHWGWTVALVVVCMIVQMSCGPESEALNRWRYNCIGGMLPFGFGLLCARFPMPLDNKLYSALFTIISAIFVFNESMSYYSWFFVPVFICSLCSSLVKLLPLWLLRPLEWMGGISAALFVCHPITRKIFIPISKQGDMYTGLLLYIVASIVLAMMIETFISMKKK